MPVPLALALLGSTALTEGVKFLYAQAGELIKRRLAKKDAETVAVDGSDAKILAAPLAPATVDGGELALAEAKLNELRGALSLYVDGDVPIDPQDEALVRSVDELRRLLEGLRRQPIQLAGEQRTAPEIRGDADGQRVIGNVIGVDAKAVAAAARIHGTARGEDVWGDVVGTRIDGTVGASDG